MIRATSGQVIAAAIAWQECRLRAEAASLALTKALEVYGPGSVEAHGCASQRGAAHGELRMAEANLADVVTRFGQIDAVVSAFSFDSGCEPTTC